MKTLRPTLLAFIYLTFSCSEIDSAVQISSKLIIGTWQMTSIVENDILQSLTACEQHSTISFDNEEMITQKYEPGTVPCSFTRYKAIYNIEENILTEKQQSETNIFEIIALNTTTLVLKNEERDSEGDITIIRTFTKQKA